MTKQRGGKRQGAGRPYGSKNSRTAAVMDCLDADKNNPVMKLVSIMNKAYRAEDLRLAADCAKALLPYYVPRRKTGEGEDQEVPRPILVNVNFPLPGSGWQDQEETSNIIFASENDADPAYSD